ncbi:helix-turn-helix domain-containing protein [Pedobacter nutrimenti]|uniref:Helix-turn-helix protein n=1 Tax=Pedobacter nutrimenti TaxID=1241337 RepID=A0A318UIH8_9SPHI|nr:helix-turn-helix transcriptional regulator [Pedobacter nutrimenti]PYF76132.1 helix-turn-helix protein [Pedobacter nutrimenti]
MKGLNLNVGSNIKEIREVEKNFKRTYVAERLNISERAYSNIENNVSELTVSRLEDIAIIFDCSPLYILNYKTAKKEFYNYFHNNAGNNGVNIMNQGVQAQPTITDRVVKLQEELLESERKRIALLEALLKNNNIDF